MRAIISNKKDTYQVKEGEIELGHIIKNSPDGTEHSFIPTDNMKLDCDQLFKISDMLLRAEIGQDISRLTDET